MDSTFAIAGDDFVILAADKAQIRDVFKYSETDAKFTKINDTQVLSVVGEPSDTKSFAKFIECTTDYHFFRYNVKMSVDETAALIRRELADSIRKSPMQINCLYAGIDESGKAALYSIDFYGASIKVTRAAHGYCGYFVHSILDNGYKAGLTVEDGKSLVTKCILELDTRFMVSTGDFSVVLITKDGIADISGEFRTKSVAEAGKLAN